MSAISKTGLLALVAALTMIACEKTEQPDVPKTTVSELEETRATFDKTTEGPAQPPVRPMAQDEAIAALLEVLVNFEEAADRPTIASGEIQGDVVDIDLYVEFDRAEESRLAGDAFEQLRAKVAQGHGASLLGKVMSRLESKPAFRSSGATIGDTRYEYRIDVYDLEEQLVVSGEKLAANSRMSWSGHPIVSGEQALLEFGP